MKRLAFIALVIAGLVAVFPASPSAARTTKHWKQWKTTSTVAPTTTTTTTTVPPTTSTTLAPTTTTTTVPASSGLKAGFNWPNAAALYVLHWDQLSVSASDASAPFRVAKANGIRLVRTFVGTEGSVGRWKTDPTGTLNDVQRMLDDAHANGVKMVLSNYLTHQMVQLLAGRQYAGWAEAQRDVTTPNSVAWNGLMAWQRTLVQRFGSHPAAYSWEVTNEPSWMLGIDNGTVAIDQGMTFLNVFQKALHDLGAAKVNMGGLRIYEPGLLSDSQLLRATEHVDVLDHHFYPDYDASGQPIGSNASQLVASYARYVDHVRALGRPLPAMIGEAGTLPSGWFTTVHSEAVNRGWTILSWGYDAWDLYQFNTSVRPEVLAALHAWNS